MPPLGHVRARGRTGLGVPRPGPARPGLPGSRDGEGAGGGEIEDLIFVFPCIFVCGELKWLLGNYDFFFSRILANSDQVPLFLFETNGNS